MHSLNSLYNQPKKIVVTGAAGRIGYHLLFLLAQGHLLGNDQPIALFMLDKASNLSKCRSIQMELEDCLFPLLQSIHFGVDLDKAFTGADYVFFCGATVCKNPKDKLKIQKENWDALFKQGESINRVCSHKTLFLMIANPCNTNTLVLIKTAINLPSKNFHALVRLDQNRACQIIAEKAKRSFHQVEKIVVWGNHSNTVVPDCFHAKICSKPISTQLDKKWLHGEFIQLVQTRGEKITAANGLSSCASPAYAAIESMKALIVPTPENSFFCSGLYSKENPFGFNEDLVFSLPCRTVEKGNYEIMKEYLPNPLLKKWIKNSEEELLEEKARAFKI